MTHIRASEMCGTRAWFLDNGVESVNANTALSDYRMALGKASEPLVLDRLRSLGHAVLHHDQAEAISYTTRDGRHTMTGHPDDYLLPDDAANAPVQLLEQKTTSNSNFRKVKRDIAAGVSALGESLSFYCKQVTRYVALCAVNNYKVITQGETRDVDPTRAWLAVTDRDSCDMLLHPFQVFATPWSDFEAALTQDMAAAIGDGDTEPDKPAWAHAYHPKCMTCEFSYRCYHNKAADRADADYQAYGKRWADYTDSEAGLKSDKEELRNELITRMRADGIKRIDIGGFTASFGKKPVYFRADQTQMRADGVLDKYNLNRDVVADGDQLNIRKARAK